MNHRSASLAVAFCLAAAMSPCPAAEMVQPISQRFSQADVQEVPDFQRHVLPLMGRLGCNGRACHGSFQGQGGFRLSLFGYDFKMDHDALHKAGSHRVDVENADASKIIQKPTLSMPHKGGKKLEEGSWQYEVLMRWVEGGAKGVTNPVRFDRLEVIPEEIVFKKEGETVPLKLIAHWQDGTKEDVTCLARFRTNDETIAEIDKDGVVTSKGKGDTAVVAFYDNGVAVTQVILPVSDKVGPNYPDVPAPTKIDQLVTEKLRKLGVVPSENCTDADFLRRVSLDVTGTLPTPDEVSAFIADSSPNKRQAKVDELLARPSYAAWWTNKLCDITGNSPRSLQLQQVTSDRPTRFFYEWIYKRVKENMPYDKLIAGIVLATSRKPGQSYEDFVKDEGKYYREKDPAVYAERETMPLYWARRNLRTADERALNFSYTFLGVRLECAQCHKHPFDQWTQDDFQQFTAFFRGIGYGFAPDSRETSRKMLNDIGVSQKMDGNLRRRMLTERMKDGKPIPWQEVFVVANGQAARRRPNQVQQVKGGRVITPKLLGGDTVSLTDSKDPRAPLMEWMRSKENPYFAKAIVNRVWANYFGRGIINPPDDMNLANPPSNPALLDYLAEAFISHGFDLKWLHREVTASQAYQRSWKTNETNRLDERNFSRAAIRRLPAEVLIDAVAQATASASDLVRRATTYAEERSIGPGVATYRRGGSTYAGRVFGRSLRETNCDCSRTDDPNLLQSIYLQNDGELLTLIDRPGSWLAESAGASVKARNAPRVNPEDAEALRTMSKRLTEAEKRVAKLRDDDQDKPADRLEAKLKELRKAYQEKASKVDAAKKKAPALEFDIEKAIREAYSRTLSRMPNTVELTLSRSYFAQSSDEEKGLRDLLWALLNTKEFITNH